MPEIKKHCYRTVFGGLISSLDMDEERIHELEISGNGSFPNWNVRRKKNWKNGTEYTRTIGQLTKSVTYDKNNKNIKRRREEIFEVIIVENSPKLITYTKSLF